LLFDLTGKIAVVTGAGSGIGAAIATLFARQGARVVILDVNDSADRVAGAIAATGGDAAARRCNVAEAGEVSRTFRGIAAELERVDILVNSAGAAHRSPIEDFTEDAYDRILALNLKGTYFMSQAIGKKMLDQGKGSIINIASIGGFIAYPHSSAYLASKGGVVQATKSFSLEWNGKVRVNAIAPGLCDTPLLRRARAESGSSSTTDFIEHRMLGPMIQPDELVAAAIFLAGDGAAKVTGHTLAVDDGYLAQ